MQSAIRKQLLQLFSEHEGEFVSGQKLSEQLGCSRTAVWKHIEELRLAGYELEAVQRKGYRIVNKPDRIGPNEIHLGLKTEYTGWNVFYVETVDSTQQIAHRLAQEGVEEGTLVTCEEQTKGRGRLGRSWHSQKYKGIWMSLILRPNIPPQQAPQLTLLAAVAVVRGIRHHTGIQCQIKWPNDILFDGKKMVGILTELQAETDRVNAVIIGIGINVNQEGADFPSELHATSLAEQLGNKLNRAELLQDILLELEMLYEQYLKAGFAIVKTLWETNAVSIGKQVTARTLNGTITGVAEGINEEGVLLLRDEEGKIHHIYSADIEILP